MTIFLSEIAKEINFNIGVFFACFTLQVIFQAFLCNILFKERLSRWMTLGILIELVGVVMLIVNRNHSQDTRQGATEKEEDFLMIALGISLSIFAGLLNAIRGVQGKYLN